MAQATVSERLASQSIEILKHVAVTPGLYEYFYENRPLAEDETNRTYIICSAEIMANFLEHIVLQMESLPPASREAWMFYVRDHYTASKLLRDFIAEHNRWYANVFLNFVSLCSSDSELLPLNQALCEGIDSAEARKK
jgi:hypothetical protein